MCDLKATVAQICLSLARFGAPKTKPNFDPPPIIGAFSITEVFFLHVRLTGAPVSSLRG